MNKTRGFTLIELLIVLAIVMIIAAVVLPLFFGKEKRLHHSDSNTSVMEGTSVPASPASAPSSP